MRHSNFNKAEGDCAFESAVEQCLFMFRRRIFPGFTVQTHLELRTKTVENLRKLLDGEVSVEEANKLERK